MKKTIILSVFTAFLCFVETTFALHSTGNAVLVGTYPGHVILEVTTEGSTLSGDSVSYWFWVYGDTVYQGPHQYRDTALTTTLDTLDLSGIFSDSSLVHLWMFIKDSTGIGNGNQLVVFLSPAIVMPNANGAQFTTSVTESTIQLTLSSFFVGNDSGVLIMQTATSSNYLSNFSETSVSFSSVPAMLYNFSLLMTGEIPNTLYFVRIIAVSNLGSDTIYNGTATTLPPSGGPAIPLAWNFMISTNALPNSFATFEYFTGGYITEFDVYQSTDTFQTFVSFGPFFHSANFTGNEVITLPNIPGQNYQMMLVLSWGIGEHDTLYTSYTAPSLPPPLPSGTLVGTTTAPLAISFQVFSNANDTTNTIVILQTTTDTVLVSPTNAMTWIHPDGGIHTDTMTVYTANQIFARVFLYNGNGSYVSPYGSWYPIIPQIAPDVSNIGATATIGTELHVSYDWNNYNCATGLTVLSYMGTSPDFASAGFVNYAFHGTGSGTDSFTIGTAPSTFYYLWVVGTNNCGSDTVFTVVQTPGLGILYGSLTLSVDSIGASYGMDISDVFSISGQGTSSDWIEIAFNSNFSPNTSYNAHYYVPINGTVNSTHSYHIAGPLVPTTYFVRRVYFDNQSFLAYTNVVSVLVVPDTAPPTPIPIANVPQGTSFVGGVHLSTIWNAQSTLGTTVVIQRTPGIDTLQMPSTVILAYHANGGFGIDTGTVYTTTPFYARAIAQNANGSTVTPYALFTPLVPLPDPSVNNFLLSPTDSSVFFSYDWDVDGCSGGMVVYVLAGTSPNITLAQTVGIPQLHPLGQSSDVGQMLALPNTLYYFWVISLTGCGNDTITNSVLTDSIPIPLLSPTAVLTFSAITTQSFTTTVDWVTNSNACVKGALVDDNSSFTSPDPFLFGSLLNDSTESFVYATLPNTMYFVKATITPASGAPYTIIDSVLTLSNPILAPVVTIDPIADSTMNLGGVFSVSGTYDGNGLIPAMYTVWIQSGIAHPGTPLGAPTVSGNWTDAISGVLYGSPVTVMRIIFNGNGMDTATMVFMPFIPAGVHFLNSQIISVTNVSPGGGDVKYTLTVMNSGGSWSKWIERSTVSNFSTNVSTYGNSNQNVNGIVTDTVVVHMAGPLPIGQNFVRLSLFDNIAFTYSNVFPFAVFGGNGIAPITQAIASSGPGILTCTNMLGQTVQTIFVQTESEVMALSELPSGVYQILFVPKNVKTGVQVFRVPIIH